MIRTLSCALLAVLAAATLGGCDSARKIPVEETAAASCTRCHGYPPSATTGDPQHPQNPNCSACHPETVASDNVTILPGGKHENGTVDVFQHPANWGLANQHGPAAIQWLAGAPGSLSCSTCHGADLSGGGAKVDCNACHSAPHTGRFPDGVASWDENCTFCHGQAKADFAYDTDLALAAPPVAVSQKTDDPAIGAHQVHVAGSDLNNPLACASCHEVPPPTFPDSLDHVNGSTVPVLSGVANSAGVTSTFDPATATCTTYCHGKSLSAQNANGVILAAGVSPAWNAPAGGLTCNSCHGSVPSSGLHVFHVTSRHVGCGTCHQGYQQDTSVSKTLHVNGKADVVLNDGFAIASNEPPKADRSWDQNQCDACHTHLGIPTP